MERFLTIRMVLLMIPFAFMHLLYINGGAVINQNIESKIKYQLFINDDKDTIKDKSINGNDQQKDEIHYKIQIAASKVELTADQLINNFNTKEILNVEIEGEWYKYSIRKKFTNYSEAFEYKNGLKINGVFIIAYKNGNKVSIEEALKAENERSDMVIDQVTGTDKTIATDNKLITYRLQIGFSTKPLSAREVSKFKNAGKEVSTVDCGAWFIYTIGSFKNESEALNFRNINKLTEAEIVKFRNNKLLED